MRHRLVVVTLLVAYFSLAFNTLETSAYSDWTGLYARVDKVILEPNSSSPERIQIWGAFAFASKEDRYSYDSPQRGYLYFSCKPGKEEVCRKEWADLQAIAGTGQVIGFGDRFQPRPRLRQAKDKPGDPDEYPLNFGLVKMGNRSSDYPPIRALKSLPKERN
ncbi:MAG TPA: hypothetical protein VKA60_17530 [Blastocatellia bacterium]|nr:hypothetical protein [Blastocatellia bacterium]